MLTPQSNAYVVTRHDDYHAAGKCVCGKELAEGSLSGAMSISRSTIRCDRLETCL